MQVTVWIDEQELDDLLDQSHRGKVPVNMNVFKENPSFSAYPCHKPIKLEMNLKILEVS